MIHHGVLEIVIGAFVLLASIGNYPYLRGGTGIYKKMDSLPEWLAAPLFVILLLVPILVSIFWIVDGAYRMAGLE